ncbi:hypothetical protein TVAG_527190 [Trichomonas vaginalis G3]|uniref:Uncharacterized protein n=1 Tax=Trichomonas vaginalis (strain ATCC PRA-98 / G3) TaxID=412133 RepID=A2G846_TRIV3|nr:hypothetical protein TVAGG3_0805930 [Trichomonas vaginalis G3]EAX86675.1 hypothetical protein TVAG_527190 [Trichomonas vaginalis G3]KAI5496857.1 hypothetical protein TVAGG3_0805930 [Trichomonas vaginalis G3]|eukprot:XP_001299605.1 hypothetical protein [Trichomonas vaginalis G3]
MLSFRKSMDSRVPNRPSYSFFDAPIPKVNKEMFPIDPAIIGRSIPRPSRPIGQISHRYANKPIKTIQPERHEPVFCCQPFTV